MTTLVGYWAENQVDCVALHLLASRTLAGHRLAAHARPSPCGWKGVVRGVQLFLQEAQEANCELVVVAIDNDGGARRSPEHKAEHTPARVDVGNDAALEKAAEQCRECLLLGQVQGEKQNTVICVPVQALETWLIVAADRTAALLNEVPEANYHRDQLKRHFGSRGASAARREELAREALQTPGALERLRQRPSFSRFEARLLDWEKTRAAKP